MLTDAGPASDAGADASTAAPDAGAAAAAAGCACRVAYGSDTGAVTAVLSVLLALSRRRRPRS